MGANPRWAAVPTAKPQVRSSAARLKTRLWLVLGLLVVAALCGPAALVLAAAQPPPAAPRVNVPDFGLQAQAQQVAAAYLAGRPSPLPVAEGVSPTFGRSAEDTSKAPASPPVFSGYFAASDGQRTWQTFQFVTRIADRSYKVEVSLLSEQFGPVLAALPALTPVTAAQTESAEALVFPGADEASVQQPVTDERIQEWAAAYAQGDAAALTRLVGDPDTSAVYVGLGGFVATEVKVLKVFTLANTPADQALAQVQVTFALPDGSFETDAAFDLLIVRPQTATPLIGAWGPQGTAPYLTWGWNNVNRSPQTAEAS